jgi:hypothetical protein
MSAAVIALNRLFAWKVRGIRWIEIIGLLMVADSDGHWQISMMLVIVFTQLMTVREATWARVTGRPALGRWIRRGLIVTYLCSLLLFAITFWF